MQAYLDNSATTRCSERAKDLMVKVLLLLFRTFSSVCTKLYIYCILIFISAPSHRTVFILCMSAPINFETNSSARQITVRLI